MENSGWIQSPAQDYLRMARGNAKLVAYAPSPREAPPTSSPKSPILYVQYLERMTQDEARAAIDEAIAKSASADVLICFEQLWSGDQSRRILKLLESRPVRTPQASLTLANLYHRLKEDDKARRELLHTCALLCTVAQYSDLESKARNLAKDLGDETLAEKPIDLELLEELGFVELKPGIQVPSVEIGVEEPVHFCARTSQGSFKTISLRAIKSASAGSGSYELAFVESSKNGRSWGSGGTVHDFSADDGCRVTFSLERLGATARFRLSTQVSDR